MIAAAISGERARRFVANRLQRPADLYGVATDRTCQGTFRMHGSDGKPAVQRPIRGHLLGADALRRSHVAVLLAGAW
jgi:hypothetical protein